MSKLSISIIPPELVDFVWEQVEPLLEKVVLKAPDDISIEAIKNRCLSGQTMLVSISEGSKIVAINTIVVEVLDSGMRILYIPVTAGSRMSEWMDDFLAVARAIARDFKCKELRGLDCRGGAWLRKLKKQGWVENHVVIKCKVGEE